MMKEVMELELAEEIIEVDRVVMMEDGYMLFTVE